MSTGASFCDRCGCLMQGSFTRCMSCGHKRMEYFSSYHDPKLREVVRRKQGFREPANTLSSLIAVAMLVLAIVVPSTVALAATSDTKECKEIRTSVLAYFKS